MKNYTVALDNYPDLYALYRTLDDLGLDIEVEFDSKTGDVEAVCLGLVKDEPMPYVMFLTRENY